MPGHPTTEISAIFGSLKDETDVRLSVAEIGAASGPELTSGDSTTTALAVFTDSRFYFSVTLEYAEWQAVIGALRASGDAALADKISDTFGLRPE